MTALPPPPRWDPVLHPPNHLRLCAMLAGVAEAEFGALRDALDVADPAMSKYVRALAQAGYVTTTKPRRPGGRPRTWVALTSAGRDAFRAHVAELQRLAATPAPAGARPGHTPA